MRRLTCVFCGHDVVDPIWVKVYRFDPPYAAHKECERKMKREGGNGKRKYATRYNMEGDR